MIKENWQLFKNLDKMTDPVNKEIFLLEFFNQIYKPFLTSYILWFKIKIFIILLYNLDLLRLYNNTKIYLRFVS